MPAPDIVRQLVERFDRTVPLYRSGKYNEAQLRQEFINPFFKALGWDVYNHQGYAEAYKEVIHEDSLEVEGVSKAPDYAFRIGGARKFLSKPRNPPSISNMPFPRLSSCAVMPGRPSSRSASSPTSRNSPFMKAAANPIKATAPPPGGSCCWVTRITCPGGMRLPPSFHVTPSSKARSTSTPKVSRASRAPPKWMMPSWKRSNTGVTCWRIIWPCATRTCKCP